MVNGAIRVLLAATALVLTLEAQPAPAYLRGVSLSGAEWGASVLPGTSGSTYLFSNQATYSYFTARGLKLIRLAVQWERLQPTLRGSLDPAYLALLKQQVAYAKNAGALVSIEIHNFGRYKIPSSPCPTPANPWRANDTSCIIDYSYNGTVKVSAADLADFWVKMSAQFKDEATVYAYDLMNEPHDMGTSNWSTISQTVLSAIRNAGDNKTIMVPGDSGQNAYFWPTVTNQTRPWIQDPANNYFYQAHIYFDYDYSGGYSRTIIVNGSPVTYDSAYDALLKNGYTAVTLPQIGVTRVRPFIDWCKQYAVPCYVGEYGTPSDDERWLPVLDNFLALLDAEGLTGTYWSAGDAWSWPTTDQLNIQPRDAQYTDRQQLATLMAHLAPGVLRSMPAPGSFGYQSAPESLVIAFDRGLYSLPVAMAAAPWPTTLDYVAVEIADANSKVWQAPVLASAPGRVSYQVPAGVEAGRASVTVSYKSKPISSGVLHVAGFAPSLFTANGAWNGVAGGVAAGVITRTRTNGAVYYQDTALYSASAHAFVARPIAIGADRLSLTLYGTGFHSVTVPGDVTVSASYTTGGVPHIADAPTVTSVGAVATMPGIDQITMSIPSSYAGTGVMTLAVTIKTRTVNTLTVAFQ